jgi:hypothetical protein
MLKRCNILALTFLFLTLFLMRGNAQNEISSPYSGFGVGLLTNIKAGPMAAMGGVSYAMQNPMTINFKNPAAYAVFDSLTFIADLGFSAVNGRLKTTNASQRGAYGRLDYLTIGAALTKRWRTSVGITPFSDVGYKIHDSREDMNYTYDGSGGLMQLYWGNSVKIAKGLSVGLNASYLFGTMNNTRYVEFSGENFLNSRIAQTLIVDGIYLSAGLQYFTNIKENHKLGFGVVYENSAYIWVKENLYINNYTNIYNPKASYDTVLNTIGERGRMVIPQSIGGGISYAFKNKLLVGVDLTWQNWDKYLCMGQKDSLKNALVTAVGLQYTPDPLSAKYMKRVNFRAGAKYSSGYMRFNNSTISEYSVSFGIGLPLRSFSSLSLFNIMFEYGQYGTAKNDLILQSYYKISLNFTLQERLYQRIKLD